MGSTACASTTLWRSKDQGQSWFQPQSAPNPFGRVSTIDIDPKQSARLYAATRLGLFRFENNQWQEVGIRNGIPQPVFGNVKTASFSAVVVDPLHPNTVYAGMAAASLGHKRRYIYRPRWQVP